MKSVTQKCLIQLIWSVAEWELRPGGSVQQGKSLGLIQLSTEFQGADGAVTVNSLHRGADAWARAMVRYGH